MNEKTLQASADKLRRALITMNLAKSAQAFFELVEDDEEERRTTEIARMCGMSCRKYWNQNFAQVS